MSDKKTHEFQIKLETLLHDIKAGKVIEGENLFLAADLLTDIVDNLDVDSLEKISFHYHQYMDGSYKGYIENDILYSKAHNNLIALAHVADYRKKANLNKKNSITHITNKIRRDKSLGKLYKGDVYKFVISNLK